MKAVKKKTKLKPRGKPFGPDNPGKAGPGRGHKKDPSPVGSELLADLEEAYRTIPTPGERPGVREARKLLNSNYQAYVTLYARLSGQTVKPDVAAAATVGPKEEDVEALAEELIREWEAQNESGQEAVRSVPGVGDVG